MQGAHGRRQVGADRDHRGGGGDGAAGFSARVVSVIASDGAGKSRRTRLGRAELKGGVGTFKIRT
jgi:hypothetical protein